MLRERRRIERRIQELKEESESITRIQEYVLEANKKLDFLKTLTHFQKRNARGVEIHVNSYITCPEEYCEWMFNLLLKNMKDVWDQSYPWNPTEKRVDLFDVDSRYLIATLSGDGTPIGFVRFKFEQQCNDFVLFIYDVHIEEAYQRHGIGKFLVRAVEFIGLDMSVSMLMTMVYKANMEGICFMSSLNYRVHSSSPDELAPEHADKHKHDILFKPLRKR